MMCQTLTPKRYLVRPGVVWSKTDGERHYIDAHRLMDLYRVNPAECVIERPGVRGEGLILLAPRSDGNYTLPELPF